MELRLVKYGYSVLDYAREYDSDWRTILDELVLKLHPKLEKELCIPNLIRVLPDPNNFPMESVHHVFSFLDSEDLLQAAAVCRMWRDVSARDELWSDLLLRKFNVSAESVMLATSPDADTGAPSIPSKLIFKNVLLTFLRVVRGGATAHMEPLRTRPVVSSSVLFGI